MARMVHHVDKECDVDCAVHEWQRHTVEHPKRNPAHGTLENLYSHHRDIGTTAGKHAAKQAVSASDIEDSRVRRDEAGDVVCEHSDSPANHVATVESLRERHPGTAARGAGITPRPPALWRRQQVRA